MNRRFLMGALDLAFVAESLAVFAVMSPAPNLARKIAINNLVAPLVCAGIWAKFRQFNVMAAPTVDDACLDWVTCDFRLTPDPAFYADRGFQGDGVNFINTNLVPSSGGGGLFAQADHAFGVWIRTAAIGAGVVLGVTDSGPTMSISTSGSTSFNTADYGNGAAVVSPGVGHLAVSRRSSGSYQAYKNGVEVSSDAIGLSALPSQPFFLLARNANGTPTQFSDAEISVAHFGAGLTEDEMGTLYAAISRYMIAIGA